jgi:choline dehydrogenase
VLPLFRRSENAERGESEWQGAGGALSVAEFPERYEAIDAFIEACCEFGLPRTDNINGAIQEGACYTQQTTHRGRRASTAAAFLHPVGDRPNLKIETRALVSRIILEDGRAVGVAFQRGGKEHIVRARAEVILCGGAINTPQLLELSGIGGAARLRSLGITPVLDLPEVGKNLQDHYNIAIQVRLKQGVKSVNNLARGLPMLGQLIRYAVSRRGLLASSAGVATGYLRSRPELDLPDVQFFATAGSVDYGESQRRGRMTLEQQPGFTVGGYTMRPESRGSVHAKSARPDDHPAIVMNYLETVGDQLAIVNQIRTLRALLRQPSLARLVEHELPPMQGVADDDGSLLDWARQTGFTAYHPVGTCRMGADEQSVVDPELRVRGIAGLRIADASIMPRLVSANTNATCIMIGEKVSDLVMADSRRNRRAS